MRSTTPRTRPRSATSAWSLRRAAFPRGRQELLRRLQPRAHHKGGRIQTVPADAQDLRPHISQRLDTETLRDLNYAVDVEGKTPENVAETWLKEEGFIE